MMKPLSKVIAFILSAGVWVGVGVQKGRGGIDSEAYLQG